MSADDNASLVERKDASATFVVLSGCSGGGKSTVLAKLAALGHAVVEEPGRRIIAEEIASGGTALPWIDLEAFLRRAIDMALADRAAAAANQAWTFFDRGLGYEVVPLPKTTPAARADFVLASLEAFNAPGR